jgi:hypothetical protein
MLPIVYRAYVFINGQIASRKTRASSNAIIACKLA